MKKLLSLTLLLLSVPGFSMTVQELMDIQDLNIEKVVNSEHEGDRKSGVCFEAGRLAGTGALLADSISVQLHASKKTRKYAAKIKRKSQDQFHFCTAALITISRPFTHLRLNLLEKKDETFKEKLATDQLLTRATKLDVIEQAQKIRTEIYAMPKYGPVEFPEAHIPWRWRPEVCYRAGKIAQATEILKILAREINHPHQSDLGSLKTATEEIETHVCHSVWDASEYASEQKKMREAIAYFLAP